MVLVNENTKYVLVMFLFLLYRSVFKGVTVSIQLTAPHLEGFVLSELKSLKMGD
jgi:hypothetical protein